MIGCECTMQVEDYSITIVQGDYGSFIYTITDEEGVAIDDIKDAIFTCSRFKLQQTLKRQNSTTFVLSLGATTTAAMSDTTCTYDITLEFNSNMTPFTVIRSAKFTILKKENPLNESDENI